MSPLVSIIIPCYNAESYVGDAIQSALDQTYRHKEVIVIDDGSTDGSLDVINSFGDGIRWETGPNRGGCAARNRGIELAGGELIQLLDADDLLHPDKLERQVPLAIENPSAVVYCDHVMHQIDAGSDPKLRSMSCDGLDPVVFVIRHRELTTIAPLHRRVSLQAAGGFRVGLTACQELDLHLRLAALDVPFIHLPEALFTVRRRIGSVSSDVGRTLAQLFLFLPEIVHDLRQRQTLTSQRAAEFAAYAARAGRICLRSGQDATGRELITWAQHLDSRAADRAAYGPAARIAKRCLGPDAVERLAGLKRAFANRFFTGS